MRLFNPHMQILAGSVAEEPPPNVQRSSTMPVGRLGLRLVMLAISMAFGGILIAVSNAQADSTVYPQSVSCTNFQVGQHVQNNTGSPLLQGLLDDTAPTVSGGSYAYFYPPTYVREYAGTANLYWQPYVRIVVNSTGQSVQGSATKQHARPWRYVWRVTSHHWLYNLYWNQNQTDGVSYWIQPGYTWYIWGTTYWQDRSGRYFYHESHYLGACSA
jgi:hypothetical protein